MTVQETPGADTSSRSAVLRMLRDRVELVRVEEIAESVGLSLSAVRFHLERLVADGMVRTAKEARQTPGRPRVMYQAVPPEAVDPGVAYRHLAQLLADELRACGCGDRAERAGRVWAEQAVAARAAVPAAELRTRPRVLPEDAPPELGEVLDILGDGGFAPRAADGGWTVELHRCPFEELMPAQADVVCAVHKGLVRALPELTVDVRSGADGDRSAAVLFPSPDIDAPCVIRFRR